MCPWWESNPRLPACKASTLSTRPGSPQVIQSICTFIYELGGLLRERVFSSTVSVRLKTGMDRKGPNNRNGPGITGTDLSFTYFFSSPIFISRLFSSYLYAYRRFMHMLAKKSCSISFMILSFCISPNVKHLSYKYLIYTIDRKHRFCGRSEQEFLIVNKGIGFMKM